MYSHRELPFAGGEQINCYKILPKSRIRNPTAVVCVCVCRRVVGGGLWVAVGGSWDVGGFWEGALPCSLVPVSMA